MRTRSWHCGTLLVAMAGVLGGCQENLKEENTRLMQENLELREELADARTESREAAARADLRATRPIATPPARPEETIDMPDLVEQPDTTTSTSRTSGASASRSAANPNTPVTVARTHTIEKGDSLYRIAQRYYGSGLKWTLIYDANRDVIGPDYNRLVIGRTITIPPLVSDD